MPRKKSDLSRHSRKAKKARIIRSKETEEMRAHRLAVSRQYRAHVGKRNAWMNSLEMFVQLESTVMGNIGQTTDPDNTESTIQTTKGRDSSPETEIYSEFQIEIKREPLEEHMDNNDDEEFNKPPELLKIQKVCPYRKNILQTQNSEEY